MRLHSQPLPRFTLQHMLLILDWRVNETFHLGDLVVV